MSALLLAFFATMLAAHLAAIGLTLWRVYAGRKPAPEPAEAAPLTIIRPISQDEPFLAATLESTFQVVWPEVEIIFCAARETDGAVAVARAVMARHPGRAQLLVGDAAASANPKLNNCLKGWQAARHDLVALVDSNVLLPPDYARRMLAEWADGVGLVSAPPAGLAPHGFWAEVEAAFLNSHQARWQLAADQLGVGFAQGKNLLFRRSLLDALGGLAALAAEPAEDAAATRLLRQAGYDVRLAVLPFPQPLGKRSWRAVWQRQRRWAILRRTTFPLLYLPELACGGLPPLVALGIATRLDVPVLLAAVALWYGAEVVLARRAGWPATRRSLVALMARDGLLPVVWLAGLMGRSFTWQGHAMTATQPATPQAATPQAATGILRHS